MAVLRRAWRRASACAVSAAFIIVTACGRDAATPASPKLPDTPVPLQFRGAAFIADVSTLKRTIQITAPGQTITLPGASLQGDGAPRLSADSARSNGGAAFSLLGGDAIDLVATNYNAGPVGGTVPGKVLITFDLQVNNKLANIDLVTSTLPTPPPGTQGVVMFPFEISVTTTSGGVTVSGPGNEVIVTSPRFGAVIASDDWNGNGSPGSGAPWNFFGSDPCTPTSTTCFRYEEYGPIPALGSSTSQTIGFLIDPTVGDFKVKMLVAADLQTGGTPQTGIVAGTVTSPQLGAIANATVSVTGGYTGTTQANGSYSISNVALGSRTVSVTNLPNGCTAPAPQTVTVTAGSTSTADFSVVCQAQQTGTVQGAVSSSQGGGLSGVTVTLTPTGGSALAPATTSGSGAYSFTGVPVGAGTGTVALSGLPANCTDPGPTPYSGLTAGGTVTLNITVTCGAPPQSGTVNGTVTSSQGGTPLSGVSVTVTPTGGSPLAAVTTNASGVYSRNSVPVPPSDGTVTLSGLPANCTTPAPAPYTGLTANGTVTVDITVTCSAAQNGTVNGTITSSQGGGLAGVNVILTPTGGSALAPVVTGASGGYTVANVPVPPATGTIDLTGLPANCTTPASTPYSGLTAGGSVTVDITVTCTAPPQSGTVSGTITSSQGGTPLGGVTVIVTPTGGGALAPVTTNGSGAYSVANVPVPPATGTVDVTGVPSNCTPPAPTPYNGLTGGGTVTVDIVVTCQPAGVTYPFVAAWGPITNTGPTGRQVALTLTIDMGPAPGRPDVNGPQQDELVGIQYTLSFQSNLLTYSSRQVLDPNLDLGIVGNPSPGITNVAQTSSQGLTSKGLIQMIKLTYDIPAGAAGTVTLGVNFVEVLAGLVTAPIDVKGNVVTTLPQLVIP